MADDNLDTLLRSYTELGQQVATEAVTAGAVHAVTRVAARSVPGVDAASITRRRSGTFETLGSTGDVATRADAIQYEVGSGPCVDAVGHDTVFHSVDLTADPRWPTFGPRAAEAVGVHSMLSIRLSLDDDTAMAGLNLYSRRHNAFDDRAQQLAMLVATHAAVIMSRMFAQEHAANLDLALASMRTIALATGVIMTKYKITSDNAFDLLCIAGQRSNRKLRDLAADVIDTGTLDLP